VEVINKLKKLIIMVLIVTMITPAATILASDNEHWAVEIHNRVVEAIDELLSSAPTDTYIKIFEVWFIIIIEFGDGDVNIFIRLVKPYYDPEVGRFTQEDTWWGTHNMQDCSWSIMQSSNLFLYCMNNPLFFADSTGYFADPVSGAVGSVIFLLWVIISYVSVGAMIATVIDGITSAVNSIRNFINSVNPFSRGTSIAMADKLLVIEAAAMMDAISANVATADQAMAWVNAQIDRNLDQHQGGHSVYVIRHRETQRVWYVGRTSRWSSREYYHFRRPDHKFDPNVYEMLPVEVGLTLLQATIREQTLISAFTIDALRNQINAMSESRQIEFADELARMTSLITGIVN